MYLDKIVDYKRQELEAVRRKVSLKDVRAMAEDAEAARDFTGALRVGAGSPRPYPVRIIAEVKKASPSAGVIRPDFHPADIASSYEENGAACLSILTDEHFFQGRLEYLESIRKAVVLPLLRKDFTLDAYHVYEARAHGADAVLLIVRILENAQVKDYAALAEDLGMAALVEVHDDADMDRAKKTGARLVGINNRNLDTLEVDLKTTLELSKKAPKDAILVSESGISTPGHVRKLQPAGVNIFLIGESLLRDPDPGRKLREFLQLSF